MKRLLLIALIFIAFKVNAQTYNLSTYSQINMGKNTSAVVDIKGKLYVRAMNNGALTDSVLSTLNGEVKKIAIADLLFDNSRFGNIIRKLYNNSGVTFAFEGNSITYGQDTGGPTSPINGSSTNRSLYPFPEMFLESLKKAYGSGLNATVVNRGYPGDNTATGITRWASASVVDVVGIMYGINDANNFGLQGVIDIPAYRLNLRTLAKRRLDQGSAVFFITPVNVSNQGWNSNAEAYRIAMKEVGVQMGVPVVDGNQQISWMQGWTDGVHLNANTNLELGWHIASLFLPSETITSHREYYPTSGYIYGGTVATNAKATSGNVLTIASGGSVAVGFNLKEKSRFYIKMINPSTVTNSGALTVNYSDNIRTSIPDITPTSGIDIPQKFSITALEPGHRVVYIKNNSGSTAYLDAVGVEPFIQAKDIANAALTDSIGIGNLKPKDKIDVHGNVRLSAPFGSGEQYQDIKLGIGGSSTALGSSSKIRFGFPDLGTDARSYLKFYTAPFGSGIATLDKGVERMSIDDAGAVKIRSLTPSRVVVTASDTTLTSSSITTTKLDYLANVTSDVQGQIGGRAFTDGSNASGTWAINITGNAATATNVAYSGLTGTIPTWNQNTTGSAASLTTSRTIFGQSFNGSANVSGALTATTGTFVGNLIVKGEDATNKFSSIALHRNDVGVDFLKISTKTPTASNSAVYFNDGNGNGYEFATSGVTNFALSPAGVATINNLSGTGTRMVVADNVGNLSTQAIPSGGGGGTVSSVSVNSANGFAGTSSGGATPALTISTNVTGILSGNGTAISAATTTGTGSVVLSDSPSFSTRVGIGNSNTSYNLDVTGTIRATGDITANSDSTLKKNIKPILFSTEKFMALSGYSFDWKKDNKHSIGLIAQEVERVFPEIVSTDNNGIKSVNYQALVAPLIQANNEQQIRIEQLEKAISDIQKRLK